MKSIKKNNFINASVFKTLLNAAMSKRALKGLAVLSVGAVAATSIMSAQAATISESSVQAYATEMKAAANSKNINKVAQLVSDDALISLSRKGKTTSLDKDAYLKLLQGSWSNTQNYHYDITINNIVTTGSQAKADVKTVETWIKDGQNVSFVTSSRVTLAAGPNNAVLLRAVSQVTIN